MKCSRCHRLKPDVQRRDAGEPLCDKCLENMFWEMAWEIDMMQSMAEIIADELKGRGIELNYEKEI